MNEMVGVGNACSALGENRSTASRFCVLLRTGSHKSISERCGTVPRLPAKFVHRPDPSRATLKLFARSGFARRSDLDAPEWQSIFKDLAAAQAAFLASEPHDADYRWPRDALHTWSRCWEYPYALYHLSESVSAGARVMDFGSGVTFFPFTLAEALDCYVTAVDVDPIIERGIQRIANRRVNYLDGHLPLRCDGGAYDAIYCVSVLEHLPDPSGVVSELARALKPGGMFVLTIDLDLMGNMAIGKKAYTELHDALMEHFELSEAITSVHPTDVLDNLNSPYRSQGLTGRALQWHALKQAIKPYLGKQPATWMPYHLACEGLVLRKHR
jgi:SAM-dependent methyltransferase